MICHMVLSIIKEARVHNQTVIRNGTFEFQPAETNKKTEHNRGCITYNLLPASKYHKHVWRQTPFE